MLRILLILLAVTSLAYAAFVIRPAPRGKFRSLAQFDRIEDARPPNQRYPLSYDQLQKDSSWNSNGRYGYPVIPYYNYYNNPWSPETYPDYNYELSPYYGQGTRYGYSQPFPMAYGVGGVLF